MSEARLARIEANHAAEITRINAEASARKAQFTEAYQSKVTKFNTDFQAHWQKLEADWQRLTQPIFEAIQAANASAQQEFPDWQPALWRNWKPPGSFKNLAPFARLEVDIKKFAEAAPHDPPAAELEGPPQYLSQSFSLSFRDVGLFSPPSRSGVTGDCGTPQRTSEPFALTTSQRPPNSETSWQRICPGFLSPR